MNAWFKCNFRLIWCSGGTQDNLSVHGGGSVRIPAWKSSPRWRVDFELCHLPRAAVCRLGESESMSSAENFEEGPRTCCLTLHSTQIKKLGNHVTELFSIGTKSQYWNLSFLKRRMFKSRKRQCLVFNETNQLNTWCMWGIRTDRVYRLYFWFSRVQARDVRHLLTRIKLLKMGWQQENNLWRQRGCGGSTGWEVEKRPGGLLEVRWLRKMRNRVALPKTFCWTLKSTCCSRHSINIYRLTPQAPVSVGKDLLIFTVLLNGRFSNNVTPFYRNNWKEFHSTGNNSLSFC